MKPLEGNSVVVNQENSESKAIFDQIKIEYEKLKKLEEELAGTKLGEGNAVFVLTPIRAEIEKEIETQKIALDVLKEKYKDTPGFDAFLKKFV